MGGSPKFVNIAHVLTNTSTGSNRKKLSRKAPNISPEECSECSPKITQATSGETIPDSSIIQPRGKKSRVWREPRSRCPPDIANQSVLSRRGCESCDVGLEPCPSGAGRRSEDFASPPGGRKDGGIEWCIRSRRISRSICESLEPFSSDHSASCTPRVRMTSV